VRWSAPEVLLGTTPASRQADIFSFGMVVVEVCSSFREHHDPMCQVLNINRFLVGVHGERPLQRHDLHRGYLQSLDGRTSSSTTWGRNIRSVG